VALNNGLDYCRRWGQKKQEEKTLGPDHVLVVHMEREEQKNLWFRWILPRAGGTRMKEAIALFHAANQL
jgi:hypothetical protein